MAMQQEEDYLLNSYCEFNKYPILTVSCGLINKTLEGDNIYKEISNQICV